MFRELGIKLDNLIWDIKDFIRTRHLKSFYYKWYAYFSLKRKTSHPRYKIVVEHLYKVNQLYKWQYDKLKNL